MAKRTTQVRLEPKTATALRKIAKSFGFNQKQGPTTGQGSVVQLLEAIVRGDVLLTEKSKEEVKSEPK